MAVVAAACVSPTTFGTVTLAGPLEMTRFTADPTFTLIPAVGVFTDYVALRTVLLDCVVTVPDDKTCRR